MGAALIHSLGGSADRNSVSGKANTTHTNTSAQVVGRPTPGSGGVAVGGQPMRTFFDTVTWSTSDVRTVTRIVQVPESGRFSVSATQ